VIDISARTGINCLPFGSTEQQAVALFGEPAQRRPNFAGEPELHYQTFIIRFDAASGLFREFTLLPGCRAAINGTPVLWSPDFLQWLSASDPDLRQTAGCIVSYQLNLAAYGFHDCDPGAFNDDGEASIHLFQPGDWDIFKDRSAPWPLRE
jgi:hypothetical protein